MKFKGTLIGEASGSISGITASHNRGGQYFRRRATPTNPNSTQQQAVRSLISQLTSLWNNGLTAGDREAWDLYAEAVPLTDKLGDPRNVGGLGMYIRGNVARLQSDATSLPRVDAGPMIYNLGDYTAPSIDDPDATAGTIDINFAATDEWANEDDSGMLIYVSRPQNATINYFKGPYRAAGVILGDATTPPTSPATITMPFEVVAGQRVFVRAVVSRADGRTSADFRGVGLAV